MRLLRFFANGISVVKDGYGVRKNGVLSPKNIRRPIRRKYRLAKRRN
jgi:hypothetical protein